MSRLLLVDLSSLFVPVYKMSAAEADPDYASKATVARVHEMASGFDGVAICCDSRKSWRKELCPEYKAQRPAQEEPLYHQLRLAKEQLAADGFPMWEAGGFEADDCIGSSVVALDIDGVNSIVVASSDKDLACLAGPNVSIKSLRSGDMMGPDGVFAKFGVRPDQMVDWLCLVGDASDNVPGVKGIGAKTATDLLQKHGSLFSLYQKLGDSCTVLGLTPALFTRLKEGVGAVETARKLITLRTDVELPFQDIFKPRVATKRAEPAWAKEEDMADADGVVDGEFTDAQEGPAVEPLKNEDAKKEDARRTTFDSPARTALATVDWSRNLEPTSLKSAMVLAEAVFAAKRFTAYNSPEDVLLAIMTGRELGINTMAALRSIHIIEGKPTLSAALLAGLVLRSGTCEQFEFVERSKERAVLRIKRAGWKTHQDVTYSVEDAKQAGKLKVAAPSTDGKDRRGMWEKDPAAMCVARCQAIGARLGWPDVIANVYDPDEVT